MKKENSAAIPAAISALDLIWQDIWRGLPNLVDYKRLCVEFHFKNPKSASAALCADSSAPRPIYVGRQAAFPRTELVVWAANRAANASKRGCLARRGAGAHE